MEFNVVNRSGQTQDTYADASGDPSAPLAKIVAASVKSDAKVSRPQLAALKPAARRHPPAPNDRQVPSSVPSSLQTGNAGLVRQSSRGFVREQADVSRRYPLQISSAPTPTPTPAPAPAPAFASAAFKPAWLRGAPREVTAWPFKVAAHTSNPETSSSRDVAQRTSLRSTKSEPRAPGAATPSQELKPEVFVYDSFGRGGLDIDNDGFGDVDHGEVVAGIVFAETGIQPTRVQDEPGSAPILKSLDGLLQRKDVSNVYLNFSIGAEPMGGQIYQRLLKLADRGARVYIAAGNEDANPLASSGRPHPNIHVVGASTGVIGGANRSSALTTVKTPETTEVVNGMVVPTIVPGGVDLNGDAKADISASMRAPIRDDAAGQKLSDVDISSSVAKLGRLPSDDDKLNPRGVVSIKVLREKGLISEYKLKTLNSLGLNRAEQDKLYVHADHLSWAELSFGEGGGFVLYGRGQNDRLQLIPQKSLNATATSWAAPNALAQEIKRRTGAPAKQP
jgi:hypothetical protein